MSITTHERYRTLPDDERHLLCNKILYRHKQTCMLQRLLHKEQRQHSKRMVAKRVRALLYKRSLDPRGEPMYSRPAPWRCIIKVNDVAYLLRISDDYAQKKLRALKKELGKKHVTVKEFCEAYLFDEEYVQCLLNDGDARRLNSAKFRREIDAINKKYDDAIKKIKEAPAKENEEGTQKNKPADEKKEAPPKKEERKIKSNKRKGPRKSFDGLDEY